jgi:autotransporter-associated beta strand protein
MKPSRSVIFRLAIALASACLPALAQLPAFPGAEGFGSIASGGRGGDVYYVTNLNTSGAGSLAEALSTAPAAGRTIVFKVSGHIRLSSTLNISKSKITIAGQTAPGDGICLWNKATNFTGSDLVIRNIRFRYGKQTAGGDAINIGAAQRIIFDHCDVMFSTDENMSSFGAAPEHMTFQWSTNAWGLSGHSAGGLWKVKHATVHHTLWANNHTRNPKLIGGEVFDWVNNLSFGWNNGFNMAPDATGGVDIHHRVNIRNSSFVHGGSTTSAIYGGALNDDGSTKFKLHMVDSALDGNNNGILDVSRTNYQMVSSTGYSQTASAWPQTLLGNPANPIIGVPVTVTPRLTGYKKIISQTGATRMEISSRPLRDEITQLCINRAANLQRGIIADPLQLNLSTGTAFADLKSTLAPTDTDLDGMPDDWEEALGYDKTTANNNTVLTALQTAASFFPIGSPAGYTRLEEYLHFKAVPHGTVAKNTAVSPSFIDIDLRKFTSGFTSLPTFALSKISGGTITQSGPGNAIVRFTPPLDSSGRAGFLFTVTDSAGDTWTQQCCLLVSTKTQPRPITWIGDGLSNNWDTTTNNFSSTLGPTAFTNNDAVTLNDSGSNSPTIKVTGALAPESLTVANTSKNFTLQGTGSLIAPGALTKSGSGTLTISNTGPNSFTSATLDDGNLSLTTTNALGSAPISFTTGTLAISADQSNALVIDGTVAITPTGSRTMNGAWSGSGTIKLTNTGSSLLTLGGSMANFSGDLSLGTSTGLVRLYGNTGSANAAFDLGTGTVTLFTRNGGSSFNLGALTGESNTILSGASSTTTVTTYIVGALGTYTTFAGRITNGGQGATALTKTGSGILTLTGNCTHSGATNINAGSLALLGNFGTSPVAVAANATLTGTGTIGGSLTTAASAILSPGADNGSSPGTLTAASLALTSPTLRIDLSNNLSTGNDRFQATGAVSLIGNQNFIFTLTDGYLTPGTYNLITTPSTLTATGVTLSSNLPTGTRQSLTLEHSPTGTAPGYVRLVVVGNQGNLTWTGTNGALWNQQTTASWSGASPTTFYNFDNVTFNDTATNASVTITQPVAPQSITVNNTAARPYSFTGAPISGSTSLVKSGSGSLTLNVSRVERNDFAITTGSPIITVPSTAGLYPGMAVVSPTNTALFPVGTTIVSVDNDTTVTLSQNATAISSAIKLIFESRNTFSGGTILNDGTLTLLSTSTQTYSSAFPPPANAFGLGTGPITLNGGILNLYGHSLDTRLLGGPLPNDLIVPAGKTATIRSTRRGTYLNDLAGLSGSLTGSGSLNLIVNFSSSAITGDWSTFSGILNVSRPATAADDPRFQLGNPLGLPLATANLDQVTLTYTATPPPEGVVVPIGSLSGTDNANTLIAGAQTGFIPVTWRVGSLNTSTTFAGNFTPYGSAPIGLEKTGTGTWTLTGIGTVSAGITVDQGTLSYGDASTDTLTGTSEISIDPAATLQLNNGAKIIGSTCEIFTSGTLRGHGTLQAPLYSSGTLSPIGGNLSIIGDTDLSGTLDLTSYTERLAVTGNLILTGIIYLPSATTTPGRKLLATYTGTLGLGAVTLQNIPSNYQATLDTATPGELAVVIQNGSLYQTWQLTHFNTLENPDGQPTADPDNDGMTNQEEFEAGTDPNSDTSFIPIVWQGGGTNPWDLATTATWLENTTPRVFRDKRHLTINDTGSNSPAITLIGTLAPGSLAVTNSTKAFTLSGTGSLSGTTGLVKSGTNTLTLATANTYSGPTAIDAGVVTLQHANALGSATGGTTVATNARLELEGNITVTGEPLTLAGTGGSSFFNGALNSKSGTNTWTGPVTLAASGTRLGAQANATLIVSGPISSTTGITIRPNDMTSTVILSGTNNYSGDTTVIGGVLKLGSSNTLPVATPLKFGASNVSGKLDLAGFNQEVSAISVTQTSGTYSNEITTATPAVLTVNLAANTTYSGRLTGSLTLAKSGTATLSLTSATALAITNSVHLDAGVLNLSSSHTISALRINGVWQPAGTYNSANSSGRLSGAGSLIVTTSGPAAFVTWIDTFPALTTEQKLPTADPDNDGKSNLAEFAFGGNPTSPADNGQRQLRTTDANNDSLPDLTLTLEVRTGTTFTADGTHLVSPPVDGITYRIEGSTDLSNFTSPVTELIPHLGSGSAKPGYTFKTFRLIAANGLPNKGFLRASAQ